MLPELVTKKDLCQILGLSSRRIEQLVSDGVITREGHPAKYNLVDAVQAYIGQLKTAASKRKQKENPELEKDKLEGEARIKQAKAEMAELELKELQGELHRAEDVEAITTDHVLYFRSMLMALPGKLAVDLAGTHTAAEQSARVKQEVNFVLDQLADYKYDPEEYAKRVRDRQGWKEVDEDA